VFTSVNAKLQVQKDKVQHEDEDLNKLDDIAVSTITIEEVGSSDEHTGAQVAGAASNVMSDSSKKYTVKETPVRSEKLKPVIKGSSDECRQVQDRMATYESLSVMRGNTLPELQVIGRFIESLPDRCKNIYSKTDNCEVLTYPLEDLDKHKGILELQEQG